MAVSYRSLGGRRRAWTVDTWAEWQAIPVANFADGDTLYFTAGQVALTRRGSRWRPDEAHIWGNNDATVVPNGTLSSEGVWTPANNPGGHLPPANSWFDVLAVVFPDRASYAMVMAAFTGRPSLIAWRCVIMTTASTTLSVTATANDSIYGGASVAYGGGGTGNDVIYYGQGLSIPGGYGGDGGANEGGESLFRPALTDHKETPYDPDDSFDATIDLWGGWAHETRNPIGGGGS